MSWKKDSDRFSCSQSRAMQERLSAPHYTLGTTSIGNKLAYPFETLCLGPAYPPEQIKQVLENCKLRFRFLLTEGELIDKRFERSTNTRSSPGCRGEWNSGRARLGNRSILASPLNPYSTENLNVYIKHRESFRKFAASVPAELAGEYFEVGQNARYLATVGRVRPAHRETFSAAILGKDLIRVHAVSQGREPALSRIAYRRRSINRIAGAL